MGTTMAIGKVIMTVISRDIRSDCLWMVQGKGSHWEEDSKAPVINLERHLVEYLALEMEQL